MSDSPTRLPARPSLGQLRKQAKELLHAARSGNAAASARLAAVLPGSKRENALLAHAQHAIAREHGFPSWAKLVHHLESIAGNTKLPPLIRPMELGPGRTWDLANGSKTSTDDVYAMFAAARDGDVATVQRLVARTPALATVEYNYTPPIHFAVREGHSDITEFLLERGADPAYKSYPFSESLLSYAEDRRHEGVAAVLRARLSRRFALAKGTPGIIAAADSGDVNAVETELARDRGLARAANDTGDTALHHAAKHGHRRVAEVLLAAGADIDAVRGDGYRPIHSALLPNWFMYRPSSSANAMTDFLLSCGARYTIFIAALRGDDTFVRDALRRDRSLANFEDTCHQRVISAAVRRGDVAMTRLLLDHGADPNLPEEGAPRGVSLWMAVNQRSRELVDLLVAHGADPNAEVESSGTPYGHATGRAPELRELLRAHGGREHEPNHPELQQLFKRRDFAALERKLREQPQLIQDASWGDGILAGPAHAADHEAIDMLIRVGARVPPVSKWAPYYYFKHERTAALLLERGMDPNHMNWHRFTLLHHMAAEGELGKARLLIEHGADIDAVDEEYRSTPLGVAARRGQLKAVKLLLESGADPNAGGAPWAMPLAWAQAKGHEEITRALTSAGAGAPPP